MKTVYAAGTLDKWTNYLTGWQPRTVCCGLNAPPPWLSVHLSSELFFLLSLSLSLSLSLYFFHSFILSFFFFLSFFGDFVVLVPLLAIVACQRSVCVLSFFLSFLISYFKRLYLLLLVTCQVVLQHTEFDTVLAYKVQPTDDKFKAVLAVRPSVP